jgi:hypothetical protein
MQQVVAEIASARTYFELQALLQRRPEDMSGNVAAYALLQAANLRGRWVSVLALLQPGSLSMSMHQCIHHPINVLISLQCPCSAELEAMAELRVEQASSVMEAQDFVVKGVQRAQRVQQEQRVQGSRAACSVGTEQ